MIQDMVNEIVDNEIASEVVGPASDSTAVALLAPLQVIEIGLAALRVESDEANWDVETANGEAAAREFRAKCVKVRTSAKAAYDQANRPVLDAQRQALGLVKKIQGFVQPIEDVWDAKIKAKEERKAREKAERERIERERIAAIQKRIAEIDRFAVPNFRASADYIKATLGDLAAYDISEDGFGEFVDSAEAARMRAQAALHQAHDAAVAREATEARLQAERAELARQQAELAAQQAAVRAEAERVQREAAERLAEQRRQIEAERATQELRQAEAIALSQRMQAEERQRAEAAAAAQRAELKKQQDAFEEERRIAREQIAAEQRKQREAEAARQAEASRIEAERASAEAATLASWKAAAEKANAQQLAQAIKAEEAAAAAKLVAELNDPPPQMGRQKPGRPSDEHILSVLCNAYGASPWEVLEWIACFKVSPQAERLERERQAESMAAA